MSEHWANYFPYIDDKIASILLDMDIWQEINTNDYNHSFSLRLVVKEPNANGFPIGTEAETMSKIEDSLSEYVSPKNFINVGRITTDGVREIIFYSKQQEHTALKDAAERLIIPNGYQFELFKLQENDNWEIYYEFLYPNQFQQQHIANQQVVDALEESGDKLEVPRKVEHWLYFNELKMLKGFAKAIKEEGFIIEKESTEIDEDEKYMLRISRDDFVDFHSICNVTDLLVDLSQRYEGEYDGWETFVIKE